MSFSPRRILLPIEVADDHGHALAEAGLTAAAELARPYGATVVLATFAEVLPWKAGIDFDDSLGGSLSEAEAAFEADLRGRLAHLEAEATKLGVKAESRLVLRGDAVAERIVKLADDEHVDAIVMPSHGRHGIRRVMLGSIAERVVRLASVPVLLLKPHT